MKKIFFILLLSVMISGCGKNETQTSVSEDSYNNDFIEEANKNDNSIFDKIITEKDTINNDITENNKTEEDVFVNTSNNSSYFVQAKLDREQARAKQKDILTEMINNNNVEENKKAECADEMLKIQQRIEKETAAEAIIEAKGFSEVYVRIDDETVDVIVNKENLSQQEIAQIEDIVKRKTGYSADKIRISPVKK